MARTPAAAAVRRRLGTLRRRLARPSGPSPAPVTAAAPRARRLQHVVVVTYGRSGSTLVQGLLNTLPRSLVRGENSFYVVHLFRAHHQLREFRALHLPHGPRADHSAFFGLHEVRPRAFLRSARALVRESLLGDVDPADLDVLGFKEVAWHRVRDVEVADFYDYLDKVLPGCRYVLHEREHSDVVGSGFWKGVPDEKVMTKIRAVERQQRHLRETRPDRVLDLHYERLTSDDAAVSDAELRALAEFVHGSCDDELLEALRRTRLVGHGPYPFGASRVEGPVRDRRPEA